MGSSEISYICEGLNQDFGTARIGFTSSHLLLSILVDMFWNLLSLNRSLGFSLDHKFCVLINSSAFILALV